VKEVQANREILDRLLPRVPNHFCFPSGFRTDEHDAPLRAASVTSAVTCQAGLNYSTTPPLVLSRFLDSGEISRIEFEAEQSGFIELLRLTRSSLRRLFHIEETRRVAQNATEV